MPVLTDDFIDFGRYLEETDAHENVKPCTDWLDPVMYQLAPYDEAPRHPVMPFHGFDVEFRPGEVTIWGGFNGSGKSMLQGQVLCGFAEAGSVCTIASMEMKPAKTLARITLIF